MSGTGLHVAEGLFNEVRALVAVETGKDGNNALAFAYTTTTGSRALVPCRPSANLAVDLAGLGVALLGFGKGRTGITAKCRIYNHVASAGVGAGTAGSIATTIGRPFGNLAVHRAGLGVALSKFSELWAFIAVLGGLYSDGALAELLAGAAVGVAGGPGTVSGNSAVDRTVSQGTLAGFLEHRTVVGSFDDGALAGLLTNAASGSAGRELGPHRYLAFSFEVGLDCLLCGDDLGATSVNARVVTSSTGLCSGELVGLGEGVNLVEGILGSGVAERWVAADSLVLGSGELVTILGARDVKLATSDSKAAVLGLKSGDQVDARVGVVGGHEGLFMLVEFISRKELPAATRVGFRVVNTKFNVHLWGRNIDVDTRVVVVRATSLGGKFLGGGKSGRAEKLKLFVCIACGGVAFHLSVGASRELETIL